ncbi:MAG TPA: tripartite tricarboxylate transporter substrate-binding protein [candidate division Zixibacteria bacterium]|nr:tripartite tricarboxylate transporter substrate-binding protein [candidate division Zixibacteria bacterium]
MNKAAVRVAWILCFLGAFLTHNPRAAGQTEPFYRGKTLRIVIGSTSGGFYDRWGRLLARHLGRYIPGQPEVIAQNMPGAGSVIAANHVFNVARPDGLTAVMPLNSLYVDQLVGRKEVQFDLRKFHWIGSPAVESVIFYMRADAPYKTIADIIKAKEPPKCGSTGTASSDYILSKVLEESVGARFNTVQGYPGGSEIDLAVEKGEVVCRAHSTSAHFGREPFDSWHKKGFDRHLIQTARTRDSRAADVPTLQEIFDQHKVSTASRRAAQIVLAAGDFGRPMMVTPGTPADRIRILREAYQKVLNDPELRAEAKKARLDVEPTSGEELEQLVRDIFDAPPEVLERARKILGK